MPTPEIASTYLDARRRIDDLVRPLAADDLARPVPACPGWTVHGVVSHLVGIVDWAGAGRLQGLPTDDDTAAQVAERVDVPTVELLDHWADTAPGMADFGAAADIWPIAIDAVTHEHDIRHALGDRAGRDEPAIELLAGVLLGSWSPSRTVQVVTPSRTATCGADGEPLTLRTTDFEVLRMRLGRRSRRQLAALDWSDDPGDVLDEVAVFPPAELDIEE
ncbi:MAG TPA: maleylpyruvate isomerase family mycothiol-dependent enzyme [Acidimicrobiales bacterium]|nr:maleylpyruvate isomerase family mycothiol-dependent enzyme [Acidimicrobiales bacterium]